MIIHLQIGGFGDESFLYLVVLIIVIFIFMTFFDSMRKRRQFTVERPITKTELICPSCELREVRECKEKDHILKKTDQECKKCGAKLFISSIYAEERKKS